MQILDALAKHLRQLEANGRSIHTIKQRERHVRCLAAWLESEQLGCVIEDVTPEVLADFLCSPNALRSANSKAKQISSVNALRSSLRTVFRFACEAGWIGSNPARLIQLGHCSPAPPRGLTEAEQARLLGALREGEGVEAARDRVLFTLMLGTGIRLGSALALDVGDVDLEAGEFLVRHAKWGRQQVVYLDPGLVAGLSELVGERANGPIFASHAGRRLSARQAQRRLKMWLECAQVRVVGAHALRHSFALGLYQRTGDVLLVREALGHRSLASTMVYTHVSGQRLRNSMVARTLSPTPVAGSASIMQNHQGSSTGGTKEDTRGEGQNGVQASS